MKLTFAVDIDGTITENGDGRIHLDALSSLRDAESAGHNVIFVTGRSSIEGYILAMFAGTTKFCIGENGGCITSGNYVHKLLGRKSDCDEALKDLQNGMENVIEKPVYRPFDLTYSDAFPSAMLVFATLNIGTSVMLSPIAIKSFDSTASICIRAIQILYPPHANLCERHTGCQSTRLCGQHPLTILLHL